MQALKRTFSRFLRLALFLELLLLSGLNACTPSGASALPTPLPDEYLPTAVALTLQAQPGIPATATPAVTEETLEVTVAPSATASELPSLTPTEKALDTATPTAGEPLSGTLAAETAPALQVTLPGPPTETPLPEIPEAEVQIYRLGDLSKVRSPLLVSAYLTSKVGKTVRVELYGEDGRLLVRNLRTFNTLPWSFANLSTELEFEISAPAEIGRLVIAVEDVYGRLMAVNSVNLILLSIGQEDLNPSSALLEAIYIQQPTPKSLVQGGTVLVSGLARPETDRPLHAELITEDGRIVGQRLVGVQRPADGGYGPFAVEVPYTVEELTPVRLIVYEDGEQVSPVTHLSSVELVLSP